MLPAEGGNDQQRNPKSGIQKIAHWTARTGTALIGYVEGISAIRTDSWLRRHIIVEAAELVPCEDERRVLPRGAIHQLIDESGNVFCAYLHAAARRSSHVEWVLIGAIGISGFDHGDLRQRAVGRI